jgi:hypothetical protein
MKATATFLTLFLALGASAQAKLKPDYSKEAIQEFVMSIDVEEEESSVTYFPDAIRFNALGTSWRFTPYPRLMMPLAGTQMGVTQQWPDAFSLTGTQIATTQRSWYTRRELKKELDSINKRLKATVKVKTD